VEPVDQGERIAFGFWLLQGEPDAFARGADDALDERELGAGWRVSNLPSCPACHLGIIRGYYMQKWTCPECLKTFTHGELVRRGALPAPTDPREDA
jgi:hypothetical protein